MNVDHATGLVLTSAVAGLNDVRQPTRVTRSDHLKGGVLCMKETQNKKTVRCDNCRREVEYGKDVITVSRGVVGPRGVIPLDEEQRFCSEECVSSYFDNDLGGTLHVLPPRIP